MYFFSPTELDQFRADVLTAHNQFRASHGSEELVGSEDLHRGAQSWADTVADTGFLQYSETAGV